MRRPLAALAGLVTGLVLVLVVAGAALLRIDPIGTATDRADATFRITT